MLTVPFLFHKECKNRRLSLLHFQYPSMLRFFSSLSLSLLFSLSPHPLHCPPLGQTAGRKGTKRGTESKHTGFETPEVWVSISHSANKPGVQFGPHQLNVAGLKFQFPQREALWNPIQRCPGVSRKPWAVSDWTNGGISLGSQLMVFLFWGAFPLLNFSQYPHKYHNT